MPEEAMDAIGKAEYTAGGDWGFYGGELEQSNIYPMVAAGPCAGCEEGWATINVDKDGNQTMTACSDNCEKIRKRIERKEVKYIPEETFRKMLDESLEKHKEIWEKLAKL